MWHEAMRERTPDDTPNLPFFQEWMHLLPEPTYPKVHFIKILMMLMGSFESIDWASTPIDPKYTDNCETDALAFLRRLDKEGHLPVDFRSEELLPRQPNSAPATPASPSVARAFPRGTPAPRDLGYVDDLLSRPPLLPPAPEHAFGRGEKRPHPATPGAAALIIAAEPSLRAPSSLPRYAKPKRQKRGGTRR